MNINLIKQRDTMKGQLLEILQKGLNYTIAALNKLDREGACPVTHDYGYLEGKKFALEAAIRHTENLIKH